MNIYHNKSTQFIPTWLYIKQHNITGLKYFGKTISSNPFNYRGSGIYWKNHLKHHGCDVSTIWCELFNDRESLTEFATNFSIKNNIAESTEWANLKNENGLDGSPPGVIFTESHREKLTLANKNPSKENLAKRSASMKGKNTGPQSIETRAKKSAIKKGKPRPLATCPYCLKIGGSPQMKQWHFDKCKFR
jgi:hypothetical protein